MPTVSSLAARTVLLFHTLRYLRPIQIFARLWFKLYRPTIRPHVTPQLRTIASTWLAAVSYEPAMRDAQAFVFLNQTGSLQNAASWNDSGKEKLWLYNLHYFDDLNARDAAQRSEWHRALIQRWIAQNPPVAGNGWEPYPLSLRIVNWIKWALAGHSMQAEWLDSLALQVRFLRKRLEYHLLGNHLLANAKALIFAGLYFRGEEADAWLHKGLQILQQQKTEQILPDGGHFELSPMYHAIILADFLDLLNLQQCYAASAEELQSLREPVKRMCYWLKCMCHPYGEVGFFNDTTLGIAASAKELQTYAARLGLTGITEPAAGLTHLADSGYIRVQQGEALALLDVGRIGPDYLPGHAHADSLCFELSLFQQPVLVNAGISCYGNSAERLAQRGTAAHNTLLIDERNSSEVWSGFRVARRAYPLDLAIEEQASGLRVSCAHDGYQRLPGKPLHRRSWTFFQSGLEVRDRVEGGLHKAVVWYHWHPDIRLQYATGAGAGELLLKNGRRLYWQVTGGQVQIVETCWHPGFSITLARQSLRVELSAAEACFTLQWKDM
ncbi:MAG: heparinase II/III family protein [gamma proteobacterium symbiont of Bathyaustriella thionipta]|nr:heparinase II/III family protein [gamma proteobacterium symbiont of Bathyaustriella thionipta]